MRQEDLLSAHIVALENSAALQGRASAFVPEPAQRCLEPGLKDWTLGNITKDVFEDQECRRIISWQPMQPVSGDWHSDCPERSIGLDRPGLRNSDTTGLTREPTLCTSFQPISRLWQDEFGLPVGAVLSRRADRRSDFPPSINTDCNNVNIAASEGGLCQSPMGWCDLVSHYRS